MLLKDLIKEGTLTVSSLYPEREAREMVLSYLEDCPAKLPRHLHLYEPGFRVFDEVVDYARKAFARMAAGEPLQYVTGIADFYGWRFRVTPDVLIPRQETELLCREVYDFWGLMRFTNSNAPDPIDELLQGFKYPSVRSKVLDLCTGSGCIAWTLVLENPGAEVVAVDVSDGALAVARSQNYGGHISRRKAVMPRFVKADVLAGPDVAGLPVLNDTEAESFDVLVSNPPYVMDSEKALMRSNVLDHEPHLALFVPDSDPLVFYRAIADWARFYLKPGGFGIVEINEALGPETAALFSDAGFKDVSVLKDLNDKDRFVSFCK